MAARKGGKRAVRLPVPSRDRHRAGTSGTRLRTPRALLAFTLSLDEFIITLFLIGSHNTLPIYIYTQVKFGITPEVNG